MTTFDLAEIRSFTEGLDARRERCDHAEGTDCANLDGTLENYAKLCWDYYEQVREWGRAVFYGRASFDPQVEAAWLDAGRDPHRRASELWEYGQEMEGDCFVLENGARLGSALLLVERLLTAWVTPRRAVAPLARHGVPAGDVAEGQRRVDAFAPAAGRLAAGRPGPAEDPPEIYRPAGVTPPAAASHAPRPAHPARRRPGRAGQPGV